MCTSAVFLAGEEVSTGYRLRLYSILLMLRIPIYLKSWRKKILRSEAHDSVVYGWPRSLPEVRTVFQIHPIPCSRSFSPGPLDKQAPISTHKFSRLTSLNSGCIWLNNCVAEWRRVPGMSRGFHFWQRQTDRQTDWQMVYKFFLINNIELKCSFVRCRKYHNTGYCCPFRLIDNLCKLLTRCWRPRRMHCWKNTKK